MILPADGFILLSLINTKLRDEYSSLDELCGEEGLEKEEVCARLGGLGYRYCPESNSFKSA
ncbi:MAG: DUF4250 domain-containing protein [Clostridia bacterium]|nr:DUF4250 domain-containing protein [Clostridia bacterium]